jgi:hypothetical protein
MTEQALVLGAIDPGAVAAVSTIVLAIVGVLTFLANRRLYRETSEQSTAGLRVAIEQMEIAKGQMAAINEQAEIARRALELQLTPRLIPGGPESCRFGPGELVRPEPQPITIVPVHLTIANAGNGVAVIETDQAEARFVRGGAHRPMTIILPPAIAPGAEAGLKLTRAAMEDQELLAGDRFELSIPYRGDASADRLRRLCFSAQYFSASQWEVQVLTART